MSEKTVGKEGRKNTRKPRDISADDYLGSVYVKACCVV
jgi:hypothetical protein